MPIHRPGEKFRYHKILRRKGGKREVVALLSLTAMVDMFTVLVVFLLQNYNTTGEVIYIPKEVVLPQAESVKELRPAHVVSISAEVLLIDDKPIVETRDITSQEEWLITDLFYQLKDRMELAKEKQEKGVSKQVRQAVGADSEEDDQENWRKVTIQADEDVDFLTIKKIMFTVTEAGASEINFAVRKTVQEIPN